MPKDPLQEYQTVRDKSVSEYPASDQEKILSSLLKLIRKTFFSNKKP